MTSIPDETLVARVREIAATLRGLRQSEQYRIVVPNSTPAILDTAADRIEALTGARKPRTPDDEPPLGVPATPTPPAPTGGAAMAIETER